LLDTLRSQLKLNKEKHTTDDMLFTIEAVSCLGACGLAPVMVINEQVYGEVNSARCSEILKQIVENETEMASAS
jgi:NADH-quinone oxidoreductase subunit E